MVTLRLLAIFCKGNHLYRVWTIFAEIIDHLHLTFVVLEINEAKSELSKNCLCDTLSRDDTK